MKDLSLDSVLESFFDYKTSSMYTAINCRVVGVKVELNDQRVDVQPLPNRIIEDGSTRERPVILNVPVIFPASKKAALTFPIDVGDTVLCVFSQRSLDGFKGSGSNATYDLQDKRRFSARDAVAIPGLFPFDLAVNNPTKRTWAHSTRDLVIVNNIGTNQENEIRLKESGNIEVRTNQDFYATFANGTIDCANLTINCTGDFSVNASNINLTASAAVAISSATMTMDITTSLTTTCPTTNWTGNFNLTGNLGLAGSLSAAAGAGGGSTATLNIPLTVNAQVDVTGAIVATGEVTGNGIALSTHTHTGDSGGTTSAPN